MSKSLSRLLQLPSIAVLLVWMLVPLSMTLFFSFRKYHLLKPHQQGWAGWRNYERFIFVRRGEGWIREFDFLNVFNVPWLTSLRLVTLDGTVTVISNTLTPVGSVLIITVVLGLAISVLVNREFPGRGIVRVMLISPFFIMPPSTPLSGRT